MNSLTQQQQAKKLLIFRNHIYSFPQLLRIAKLDGANPVLVYVNPETQYPIIRNGTVVIFTGCNAGVRRNVVSVERISFLFSEIIVGCS